jgi:hypothetical protein
VEQETQLTRLQQQDGRRYSEQPYLTVRSSLTSTTQSQAPLK